jgi:hypothetical protein
MAPSTAPHRERATPHMCSARRDASPHHIMAAHIHAASPRGAHRAAFASSGCRGLRRCRPGISSKQLSAPPATLAPPAPPALKRGQVAGSTGTNGSAAPLMIRRGRRCLLVLVIAGRKATLDDLSDAPSHPARTTVCDPAHASVLCHRRRSYLRPIFPPGKTAFVLRP